MLVFVGDNLTTIMPFGSLSQTIFRLVNVNGTWVIVVYLYTRQDSNAFLTAGTEARWLFMKH